MLTLTHTKADGGNLKEPHSSTKNYRQLRILRVGVVFPQEEGVPKLVIQNRTTSPEIIHMQH